MFPLPRTRRLKSETGIYHVVLRGINKQTIFEDEEDNEMFLVTVNQYRKQSGYLLLAYCLMGNHIHLLMKTGSEELGQIFRRIGASYVYWYNRKYERTGHLFQDRYKSEAVETDAYLFAVLRYVHQNPLKAGLVKNLEDYPYSSFAEYLGLNDENYVDKDFVLSLFHEDRAQAIVDFREYNELITDEKFLDISDRKYISDKTAIELIKKKYSVSSSLELQGFESKKREKCIRFLLDKGLSVRQISRLTGITRYVIQKI
ncbi:MAG TPA: transposase [Thermotogota bacterium]|nr:transposase [Thermotogota bacterium]